MSDSVLTDPDAIDPSSGGGRERLYLLAGAIGIVLIVTAGLFARSTSETEQADIAANNALPSVQLVRPQPAAVGSLDLPGTLEADNRAQIHARTSGYIARWNVDIGDRVRRGQVLAMLDAPELDQQLMQARADYRTAEANRELAATTAARWQEMRAIDAVSQQETDERVGQLAAASARSGSAQANVSRLRAMQGFTRITAPFSGVVVARNAETGALVNAGGAGTEPLFTIADDSRLRLRVRVPQALARGLSRGTTAQLSLPEYPGETFEADLARIAGAVDPQSGTMLAEFVIPNGGRRLSPGSYAQVSIPIAALPNAVTVPASSIIATPRGSMVALADTEGRVRMQPVQIGRDDGQTVQIVSGLTPQARLIGSPPEAIANGDRVRIVGARRLATGGDGGK